jgi:hypothetical protein
MVLAIDKVTDPRLINELNKREYRVEPCKLPTRKGHYLIFKAKGLSPGFTWFVGINGNGEYIEEDLMF